MHCLVGFVFLCVFHGAVHGSLDTVLKHYELVHPSAANRKIVKRGANNPNGGLYNRIEELQFSAFNRDFRLFLTPKRGLLHSKFKAVIIGSGRRVVDHVHIDPDQFMEGHVFGERGSKVTANIDENGALNALILLPNEAYTVEPAWRHLEDVPLDESIIYRHSDLILPPDGPQHSLLACPAKIPGQPADDYFWSFGQNVSHAETSDRIKRQSFGRDGASAVTPRRSREKNRCPLKLVADYRFFQEIGRSKASLTSRYLINLIDRVNTIYTNTVWRDSEHQPGITNYGFVIKKIVIHTNPSRETDHYNSNTSDTWHVDRLLQKFSEVEGSRSYCLAHLFTYRSFKDGVLGLGYISSTKEGSSGGICSAPLIERTGRPLFYNTALSSAKSSSGGPVVTREADIVTAHEFGHNWGSPHDPSSAECSPVSKDGGSFIMYTYSVSGYDDNNKRFSPCSRRTIKAVLEAKAHLCFQEEEVSFCGNHRVEPGEECDEGLLEGPDSGQCCTSDCKFKPNAKCSPKNSLCCSTECQYEQFGTPCRDADRNRCLMKAVCNGTGPDCPRSSHMTDGTECLDKGECQNGTCVSFCEKRSIGMKPCICENITTTCFRCCRKSNSSECTPYMATTVSLPLVVSDGTRCILGYCEKGDCKKQTADFVSHWWRIIDKLDINGFWKFLCDNIVGTIIAVSLIFWIPASCIVHRLDARTRKDFHDNLDFIVSDILVAAGDQDRVTVIQEVKSVTRDNPTPAAV